VAVLILLALLLPPDLGVLVADVERGVLAADAEMLESARGRLLDMRATGETGTPDRVSYTLAYVNWRLARLYRADGSGKGESKRLKKRRSELLKEAEAILKDGISRHPGDAEAHALLGTVHGASIGGMWSGMRLGPRAEKSLKRAGELEPENPRVALQMGLSAMFKPSTFGGGVDRARSELERATELFEAAPRDSPWPNWGAADAWAWLGLVHAKDNDIDSARAAYEKALLIAPDYRWVKDTLLPSVDSLTD
jgi:cytochrome c-type biogenesis protein CcmH/NrfG